MLKKTESLKKTLGHAYILTIVGRGADMAFYIGIFSVFSIEDVGLYSWAIAVSAFYAIALDLGLVQTLVRAFSKNSLPLRSAAIGSLVIRIPIFVIAIICLIAWNYSGHLSRQEFLALALAGATQTIVVMENVSYSWLKANARQTLANIVVTLDPLGRLLALGLLLLLVEKMSVQKLLFSVVIVHGFILGLLSLIVSSTYRRPSITPELALRPISEISKNMLKSGAIFGLIGLATVMQNRLDWLMVSTFSSRTDLANYSLANKAYEILQMFIGVAMLTVYPWICRTDTTKVFRIKINVIVFALFSSGVVLSLSMGLYLPSAVRLIWGQKYQAAEPLLQMLLPLVSMATAIMVLYYPLIANHFEKQVFKVTLLATVVQVITNLALIPTIGAYGAVIGMGVLTLTTFTAYAILSYRLSLTTGSQLTRYILYIITMFFMACVLWATEVSVLPGILTIAILGLLSGYFVLMGERERSWSSAWIQRQITRRSAH